MANRNSTLRVALYARVSTKNNGQDPETQLMALRDYAKARKLEVFAEYVDIGISGSKDSRPALNRLMADARKRRFRASAISRLSAGLLSLLPLMPMSTYSLNTSSLRALA